MKTVLIPSDSGKHLRILRGLWLLWQMLLQKDLTQFYSFLCPFFYIFTHTGYTTFFF
jgi:hypothetical protein